MREAGFSAAIRRGLPFKAWYRGEAAAKPGLLMPGARGGANTALAASKIALNHEVEKELDRLAEEHRARIRSDDVMEPIQVTPVPTPRAGAEPASGTGSHYTSPPPAEPGCPPREAPTDMPTPAGDPSVLGPAERETPTARRPNDTSGRQQSDEAGPPPKRRLTDAGSPRAEETTAMKSQGCYAESGPPQVGGKLLR